MDLVGACTQLQHSCGFTTINLLTRRLFRYWHLIIMVKSIIPQYKGLIYSSRAVWERGQTWRDMEQPLIIYYNSYFCFFPPNLIIREREISEFQFNSCFTNTFFSNMASSTSAACSWSRVPNRKIFETASDSLRRCSSLLGWTICENKTKNKTRCEFCWSTISMLWLSLEKIENTYGNGLMLKW